MDDWQAVADAINARMVEMRLTQRDLSNRSGVSLSTVRELQHGVGGRQRSAKTLASIAEALGWEPDRLHRIARGETVPETAAPRAGDTPDLVAELRAIREHLARIDLRLDKMAGGDPAPDWR